MCFCSNILSDLPPYSYSSLFRAGADTEMMRQRVLQRVRAGVCRDVSVCALHKGRLQKWHFLLLALFSFCSLDSSVQQLHLMNAEFEVPSYSMWTLGCLGGLKAEASVAEH